MTRALNRDEIHALQVGTQVARFIGVNHMQYGSVERLTRTMIKVAWPYEDNLTAYSRETGARTDCHGEVLRSVPTARPAMDHAAEVVEEIEHATADLGAGAANIEPNDEAQIVATVRADRARAKTMGAGRWMNEVERYLRERLRWEHATPAEHEALQRACETQGTDPARVLERDLERREAPYYTAASLSAWVVRQRRACIATTTTPDYLRF
jgi:predicted Fe-S protein YdhL (DUF1289 family)